MQYYLGEQEIVITANTCENCSKGASYEEALQGPHKWRQNLRHVPSKRSKKTQQTEESSNGQENHYQNFENESDSQHNEDM